MVLLLQYTLTFASVLILVALGGCFSEHSGVINLGLEGVMIMGALGGALAMRYMPSTSTAFSMLLVVLLAAALAGTVYSSLLAVACINFKADQTIVGTALNMLGTAGATVIVKAINTAANPDDVSSTIQYAGAKKAFLVNIGSFEFSWFMLVTVLLLIAAYVVLYKTRFGLRLLTFKLSDNISSLNIQLTIRTVTARNDVIEQQILQLLHVAVVNIGDTLILHESLHSCIIKQQVCVLVFCLLVELVYSCVLQRFLQQGEVFIVGGDILPCCHIDMWIIHLLVVIIVRLQVQITRGQQHHQDADQ